MRRRRLAVLPHPLSGALGSVAALAGVTALVFLLRSSVPVLSLGVLYLFAVLPIAVVWGRVHAVLVAVASMLAFNFFFLPPVHTFHLADGENWLALAVYLATAVVVSELAARSRHRAAEAEQRAREASLLAEVAGALLETARVEAELGGIASRVARVLGVEHGRIELDSPADRPAEGFVYELAAGNRRVGRLLLDGDNPPDPEAAGRVLPALTSLLAVASERERLARSAIEAETLRRSDVVKTAILRAVSHDLRSPLTAIRAATEGLEDPSLQLGASDRAALLATVDAESRRLDRLVGNLLDLSRLEAGAALPRPELWAVEELVGRALGELGADAERVSVSLAADLPPLEVDGSQVERVLANLLENALKFSSPVDPVVLEGECHEGEVIVRVTDRGPGLGEAELERIFEPFERGEGGAASRGTGLGLAIARGFAQANGGRVWAEKSVRDGAQFALALPVAARTRTPR